MPTPERKTARIEALASLDVNARRLMTDRDAYVDFLNDLEWVSTELGVDLVLDVFPAARQAFLEHKAQLIDELDPSRADDTPRL